MKLGFWRRWLGREVKEVEGEFEHIGDYWQGKLDEMRSVERLVVYYRRRGGLGAACRQIHFYQVECKRLQEQVQKLQIRYDNLVEEGRHNGRGGRR